MILRTLFNLRVISCCKARGGSMSTEKSVFKVDFRLPNQIIGSKKVPIIYRNC